MGEFQPVCPFHCLPRFCLQSYWFRDSVDSQSNFSPRFRHREIWVLQSSLVLHNSALFPLRYFWIYSKSLLISKVSFKVDFKNLCQHFFWFDKKAVFDTCPSPILLVLLTCILFYFVCYILLYFVKYIYVDKFKKTAKITYWL